MLFIHNAVIVASSWKNQFPTEWQEIIQRGNTGEKHIADVKTKDGWVIEFQHSEDKVGDFIDQKLTAKLFVIKKNVD